MTKSLTRRTHFSASSLFALPLAALVFVACTGDDTSDDLEEGGSAGKGVSGAGKGGSAGSSRGGTASAGAAGNPEGGVGGAIGGEGGSFAGGQGGSFAGGEGGSFAGGEAGSFAGGQGGSSGEGGSFGGGEGGIGGDGFGGAGAYDGPSVGRADTFAALAYGEITTANISVIRGELGVSSAAVSSISGFDAPTFTKYGNDSLAPNSQRTILAQQDVTALVSDIDPRPCDTDLTNVVGGLTGDITLHPGVTCMNSTTADAVINGHVYLDAGGDPNAFFVIRGNLALNVANGAEVVLQNGAQACGVFWRIATAVTIGTTVNLFGTVVAGSAITMNSGSTLNGRALAQTAGVHLDANAVLTPLACTHVE